MKARAVKPATVYRIAVRKNLGERAREDEEQAAVTSPPPPPSSPAMFRQLRSGNVPQRPSEVRQPKSLGAKQKFTSASSILQTDSSALAGKPNKKGVTAA